MGNMDDFLAGVDDNNDQTGDAVVVNQTGSDDFAFMNEVNPHDKPSNDDGNDAPKQDNEDPFASMINNDNADNDDNTTNELKQDEIGGTEQKEKSEDEPTFLSV